MVLRIVETTKRKLFGGAISTVMWPQFPLINESV